MSLPVTLVHAGQVTVPAALAVAGGGLAPLTLPARVALIEHPVEGRVLVDTGWAPRVRTAPIAPARAIYPRLVPFEVDDATCAAGRLRALGVPPDSVRHVVLTHLHADHVGGLADFPAATVHAHPAAWDHVQAGCRLALARHGVFPELLPADLAARLHLHAPDVAGAPLHDLGGERVPERASRALGGAVDLFGDGAIRLVALPGHAPGQVGVLVEAGVGPVLFCGDAVWTTAGLRRGVGAHPLVDAAIATDVAQLHATRHRLHTAWKAWGDVMVVPCHCPEFVEGRLA